MTRNQKPSKAGKVKRSFANQSAGLQKHKRRNKYGESARRQVARTDLVAKPVIPKSKHKSYFMFAENEDKKKKIEFEVTDKKEPSPNFTFVPVGNPELTKECKEISREEGALIYIVSGRKELNANIGEHVHRIGYHFRTGIVQRAREKLEASEGDNVVLRLSTDRIPETQEEINAQADGAIRDLYPRIPNTDREMILQHAFQKGAVFKGKPVVGLQEDLSLSRRVQLAVIAHIRHTHTRYDLLLRETSWENARKAVESLCLDILVKWRGDEETGRDQLDEVLREIVVISDSEEDDDESDSDDDDEDDEDEDSASDISEDIEEVSLEAFNKAVPHALKARSQIQRQAPTSSESKAKSAPNRSSGADGMAGPAEPYEGLTISSRTRSKTNPKQSRKAKRAQKGFKRYQAWQQAISRRQEMQNGSNAAATEAAPAVDLRSSVTVSNNVSTAPAPSGFQRTLRDYNEESYFLSDQVHDQRPTRQTRSPVKLPTGQPVRLYQEKVIMIPDDERLRDYQQGFAQDTGGNLRRREPQSPANSTFMTRDTNARDEVVTRLRRRASQDLPLPSIEPVIDPVDGFPSPARRIVDERPRYTEVRHQFGEREPDHSRPLPRRDIIYVDVPENQPKRRRIIVEDEAVHSTLRGEESKRYETRPPQERYFVPISAAPGRGDYGDASEHVRGGGLVRREQIESRPVSYQPVRVLRRFVDEDPSLTGLSLSDRPIHIQQGDLQPGPAYDRSRAVDQRNLSNAWPMSTHFAQMDSQRSAESIQPRLAGSEQLHSFPSFSNDSVSATQSSLRQVPISHLHSRPESRHLVYGDSNGRESPHQFPPERVFQQNFEADPSTRRVQRLPAEYSDSRRIPLHQMAGVEERREVVNRLPISAPPNEPIYVRRVPR